MSGSEDESLRDDNSPIEKFSFDLTKPEWEQLNLLIEPDGKLIERFKLKTEYVKLFEEKLSNIENLKITLRDRKSRVYNIKRKRTTNFLVGYTICFECICRYYFTIKERPSDSDEIINVLVKKVGVHEHNGKRIKAADKIKTHRDKKNKIQRLDGGETTTHSHPKTIREALNGTHTLPTMPTSSFILLDNQSLILNNTLNNNNNNHNENYDSIETYRSLFKKYESKENNSAQDLYSNLIFVANTQKTCINAKYVPGFLGNIKIFDDFSLTMHSEYQIKQIDLIKCDNRVLHLSLAANLVKFNNSDLNKSNKLFNIFALLKDFRSIGLRNVKSLLISEMISSKFSPFQMVEFLSLIKKNYNDVHPKTELKFKYIIVDFLWECVHAVLNVFNNETVIDYSKRVYKHLEDTDLKFDKSWVVTCASHSMTKFISCLKKKFKDSKLRMIACFVFSLMLNSTSLEYLKKIFRLVCLAFLSRLRTDLNYSSLKEIQSLISRKSKDETEILKCLNSVEVTEKGFMDEQKKDIIYNLIDEATIREQSPFTELFQQVESDALKELSTETSASSTPNVYYSPEFIKFLQHNFMPFAFLWVNFGLSENSNQITRMTNGLLDQYIGLKKNMVKQENEAFKPVQYAMLAYPQVRHKTEQFVKYQQEELQRKIDDDIKYSENESYYQSLVDNYLDNDKDETVEYVDLNLNEIEFDLF
ncbi:unnamed protein product [Brachionus calyciflorus]|uniref:Uncharacterized protein n=1 Tax=Brachionus calyciflorus TaxID=104777 RepID=A0A814IXC8_9BILA|nr:unnamed protein product [Brachionus calyciflorus]